MRDLTYTKGKLSVINGHHCHNNIGDVWSVVMNFIVIHSWVCDVDCNIHNKLFAFYQTKWVYRYNLFKMKMMCRDIVP